MNLKPLEMTGVEHADGALSVGDRLMLWDNKSKEGQGKDRGKINLKDFLMKQIHLYMEKSENLYQHFLLLLLAIRMNQKFKPCNTR